MSLQLLQLNGNLSWVPILGGGTPFGTRDALVPKAYRPGPDTTGVYEGSILTRQNTDITLSAPQTIANMDFNCSIFLRPGATNVKLKNCILRSNGVFNSGAPGTIVGVSGNLLGLTLEDCTIDLTGHESPWVHGIQGYNFTAKRCEILRGHDGVGLVGPGGNVNLISNWIHNSAVFGWTHGDTNYPSFSDDRTHNDAIQIHRGQNINIIGNMLGGLRKYYVKDGSPSSISIPDSADDYDNSCIIIQQEVSNSAADHLAHVLIDGNWMQGGAASMNIGYKFGNDLSDDIRIINNRQIRRISPGGGFYLYKATAANPFLAGNVFDDDGTPTTVTTY